MNLLTETIERLKECDKEPSDVEWCQLGEVWFTWDEFASLANFEYDNGYGSAEVDDLKIVGSDWWLERGEYDGSEWWDFHRRPDKPETHQVPETLATP